MSQGPGRVQGTIAAAFAENPSATFAVDELADLAYPGVNQIEKKHQVAVIRAADAVAKTHGWVGWKAGRPGHPVIYFNRLDLRSYAMGQLRTRFMWAHLSPERMAAVLDDPKALHSCWADVQPGGTWWMHVEISKARAAGKDAEAEEMVGVTVFDPWHYVPVLARKPGALRNGAPFKDWLLPSAMERIRRKLAAAPTAIGRWWRSWPRC